ncbi:MAG TPA: flavodoxin family protein, partial [Terriglobales bacterium]
MKILGISVGRKNSNTEILVKETLMGAQEAGAEVEFIRLHDFFIKPCTGCNSCVIDLFEKGGSGHCTIHDDDFNEFNEKFLDCDGMVVGSPIYEKSPSGLLKTLNDRMGPSHDMAFQMIAREIRKAKGITKGTGPDPRFFKQRASVLIGVGGSEWDTLAAPLLHLFVFPMQVEVLDKIIANWVALPGAVLFREDLLTRAHNSGKHLAECLKRELTPADYIGEPGLCPMCHSKLVEIREDDKNYPAICGICGVRGTLTVVDNKVKFEIAEKDRAASHVLLSGKFMHADELKDRSLVPHPNMHEIPERIKKYKEFITP